jgi:hypothetical protein
MASNPAEQLSVQFVLATGSHLILLRMLCGKWNARKSKRPIYDCSFPMHVSSIFINCSSSFNPSHPHVHPSHHTHLITLSLSRRQGPRPLVPCLNGQSRNPTPNLGGEEERTPLTNQGKRRSYECPYPRTRLYVWIDQLCRACTPGTIRLPSLAVPRLG